MKSVKKIAIHILSAMLLITAVMSLSACDPPEGSLNFMVYYMNYDRDDIIYREWTINDAAGLSSEEITNLLLDRMFEKDMENEQLIPVKPDSVKLNGFTIEDSQITFDFDSNYLELSNSDEILLRAGLVLTMIQQPKITQVLFTVNGEPLKDSNGEEIGVMYKGNFVDILLNEQGMLKQETEVKVFFMDETGTKLIPANYQFTINNSKTSKEEYILQRLKEGPAIEGRYRTIAEDVEVLSVATSGNVCYVNFGRNFLEQEQSCSDEIMVYSIVNSLCSLPNVKSVQFMVDGSTDVILHTVMDLREPLKRNRKLEQ